MAYPDYSIVIISVTTNGVTTDYASAFYNEQLAKKFYTKAINDGNRAFYFEKPKPSKFTRNDAQPLKINTEAGAENNPISEVSTEQKVGEVMEFIRNGTPVIMIGNALGVQEEVDSQLATLGERTYEIWKNFNNFLRRAVGMETFTPYGTPVLTITKSNKRVTWKADGLGQFVLIPDIEKIWPDKDETEDSGTTQVIFQIDGYSINVGTKIVRKTYLGLSATSFTSEDIYNYIEDGTIVLETDSKIYRSDGNGEATPEDKDGGGGGGDDDDDDDDNNPAEGTNLGPDSNDPCYDRIANGSGGYTLQSNGSCDDDDNDHPTAGTDLGVDPNDACYNLIADGMGGSTQQSNGSCDDDGDGGDGNPAAGTNLGVDPNDSCYDLIADGTGGSTQQSNGSCDDDDDDNDHPTAGTDLGVDPNDACYNLIADGTGGTTQQSNGSCDDDSGGGGDNGGGGDDNGGGGGEEHPPAGTNLGAHPLDSCDDRIADGMGGFTLVDNGTCTEGGGGGDGDGDGDGGGGGGGDGEEGEERTDEDPLHSDNGQFSDYEIAANWDGGHPYNANGELHMVKLDPESGLWVEEDPAV